MTRRGFTLVELLVTMAVLGILGGALARITINQSRYVSRQEALMEARQTARQAMALMTTELRRVSDRGMIAWSADSIRFRLPYAFGMLCGSSGGSRYATLLPYDSIAWANAEESIGMWRSGGAWIPGDHVTVMSSMTTAVCDADSIRAIPGGRLVTLSPASAMAGAQTGDIIYLFERVTYLFGPSTSYPGRRALYRDGGTTPPQEVLAPFSTMARFGFLVGSRLTPTLLAPSVRDSLTGIELRLVAESSTIPAGTTAPITYDLRARVRFGNMPLD